MAGLWAKLPHFDYPRPRDAAPTFGLTQAGATASFRLVATTDDGHEKGSEPVVVTRPL
jgi:hypothetical protein